MVETSTGGVKGAHTPNEWQPDHGGKDNTVRGGGRKFTVTILHWQVAECELKHRM